MKKRMYRQGKPYKTIGALCKDLNSLKYVFWFQKPLHPGWIKNMTLSTVMGAIGRGILRRAIKQKEATK